MKLYCLYGVSDYTLLEEAGIQHLKLSFLYTVSICMWTALRHKTLKLGTRNLE